MGRHYVGRFAFESCANLKTLEIQNGVKILDHGAFSHCGLIGVLDVPSSVTNIQDFAFNENHGITEVNIHNPDTYIGGNVFKGCENIGSVQLALKSGSLPSLFPDAYTYSITNVTILSGETNTDEGHFYPLCCSLRSVSLPHTITEIGVRSFRKCPSLEWINIPDSVKIIGDQAFEGCPKIKHIDIPLGIAQIGRRAFADCKSLGELAIGENVLTIGEEAFAGCDKITSISLPVGIEEIRAKLFLNCSALEMVRIPATVKTISRDAFDGCVALKSVSVPACVTSIASLFWYSYKQIENVQIDETVTEIPAGLCQGLEGLKSVTIPESATRIGDFAFMGCAKLENLPLHDGVEVIGNRAFEGCETLSVVMIPSGVWFIGSSSFYGCKNLSRVAIPASVTHLCSNAFYGCALSRVYVETGDALRVKNLLYESGCNVSDIVFVENWEVGADGELLENHLITFDPVGGEVFPQTRVCRSGGVIGELPVPTRSGYSFELWKTGEGEVVTATSTVPQADTTLYATWTPNRYSVGFDANGGEGAMEPQVFAYGEEKPLRANAFVRLGYTFAGWAFDAATGMSPPLLADAEVVSNLTTEVGGVVTLYARWTPNEYTVDFNPGRGGTGTMPDQPMTYDEEEALCSNLFSRTGYTFFGWTDDESEVEEVLYYDGVVVSNLTAEADGMYDLYAIWAANEYMVVFDANGGTGTMEPQAFVYDVAQVLKGNVFEREDYTFAGWELRGAAGVRTLPDCANVKNLTDVDGGVVTLYAVWHQDSIWGVDDKDFSAVVANVYDGVLLDANDNLAGVVQVKTAKQVIKTTTDKKTKVKTVTTNITATATVTDANGKKWSYSKGGVTVDGVVSGLMCTTKDCPVAEFGVTLGKNGMEGEWGEYAIVGARNGMDTKGDAMKAALEAYKGKWSVCLSAPRGEDAAGTVRIQLDVQAKGVVKIAGNWENGAKVSASAQLVMGDGFAYVPVMVKATKTSPALNALLRIDPEGGVALLSAKDPARPESAPYQLVAGGRSVDELGEPVYCPSEVSAGGKAFGARVAVNELAYPAKFAAKKLPAGLKIDAATGVISGTPTKPGHYVAEVTVTSGLNSKVKKTLTVEFDIANYTDGLIPIRDSYGPYYVGVAAEGQIAAAAGCSVSGLPAGIKWTAKNIVDTKTKAIKTAANTIYGVPTKACTNTVYFKKTVKEAVNGKAKSVTHQASATFIVEGMKPWAVGEFNGGSINGMVTLTVAKTGKISGKWMSEGLTWTLSAASFDAYISSEQMYVATVIGKSGKLVMTNEIDVTESGIVGFLTSGQEAASPFFEAWRNGWKEGLRATLAKQLKGKKKSVGDVALTVGANGTVTAKGTFVTGFDGKKQKDITYSASCSTVLIPMAETGLYKVYLYFPPKSGKFDGFSACERVMFVP